MNWTSNKLTPCPKPREGSSFTTAEDSIYIFGGAINIKNLPVPVESNELWKFDLKTQQFSEIISENPKPCTRANSSLTFMDGKLYLFGGITEKQGWIGDLWSFDIENSTWEEIEIDGSIVPSPRCMHTLTAVKYNNESNLMLFGGFGPTIESNDDDWEDVEEEAEIKELQTQQEAFSLGRFNDTYLFNIKSKSWQFLHFDQNPAKRAAHRMVYLNSGKTILFGGKSDSGRLGDLWEFEFKNLQWKELTGISELAPRSFHEMCPAAIDSVFIHGGRDNFDQHLSDCFKLSFGGENGVHCEKIDCEIALGNHMFLADFDQKIFIFGGSSNFDKEYGECKNYFDDLWVGSSSAKKAKMEE